MGTSMMDRLKLTGLTKIQAEECLDWLQNHGYSGCKAQLHGDRWSIVLGTQSPGGTTDPVLSKARLMSPRFSNRLPASGS